MRKRNNFLTAIIILAFMAMPAFVYGQQQSLEIRKLIIFYSPACHKCQEVKNELIPQIQKKFKDKIEVEYCDISDIENYKLLLSLQEKYKVKIENVWPVFYFQGQFLNAQGDVKGNLNMIIANSIDRTHLERYGLPAVDLFSQFKALTLVVVVIGGLVDGINPCAFTVIVFFISFLALQGYKKKELITIGLCFIFSVFLTYFLIGLGLFEFFYRLGSFWFIRRIFNLSVGIFCIILGALAIYDFFRFKRTNKTEGLILQLPALIKNQIHYIIGLHYRKTKASHIKQKQQVLQPHVLGLVTSAFVIGFLISILEGVCTGQTYIPIITFVRARTYFRLQAVGYLLLYNLMFIVPLLIIFLLALLGVTSEQFSKFLKNHLLAIKILMAILFFSLGILLIWRA